MGSTTVLDAMQLPELKKRVWRVWTKLNSWGGELTSPPQSYVAEIKGFGDRRYKKTWVRALARFEAMRSYETCLDSSMLIVSYLNFKPNEWDYEYRHEIMDEFLLYPDGLELIRDGLEQLFSSNFCPQERDEANGFFRLLEEREKQCRGIGIPVRSVESISGTSPAT